MPADGTDIASATVQRFEFDLEAAFTIARGTTLSTVNHIVTVQDEAGRTGRGAAAPSAYYDESQDSVESVMPDLLEAVESVGDPLAQQRLQARLADIAPDEAAARAAVSVAVHDLAARQRGEPLYRQWGLDPSRAPDSSYTIGIDEPEKMADRARAATEAGVSTLKVKLGTDADRQRLEAVREAAPTASIRVDANCEWSVETAIVNGEWLADVGVEFVEQPVPAGDADDLTAVAREIDVSIAADESCVTAGDVPDVADAVDCVVVKLMKCGGIRPALTQIQAAHAHDLDVMLGCMVESATAISGAANLAPLVEFADLDGSLLLTDDRWTGPVGPDGVISLADIERGTGATPAET